MEDDELTSVEYVDAATEGELVSADDSGEDEEESTCEPPTNWVSEEINLFSGIILGPEADAAQ